MCQASCRWREDDVCPSITDTVNLCSQGIGAKTRRSAFRETRKLGLRHPAVSRPPHSYAQGHAPLRVLLIKKTQSVPNVVAATPSPSRQIPEYAGDSQIFGCPDTTYIGRTPEDLLRQSAYTETFTIVSAFSSTPVAVARESRDAQPSSAIP